MQTYWDAFIDKFEERLPDFSLRIILMAFYEFCQNNEDVSDQLLTWK